MNTNSLSESIPRRVPLTLCLQTLFGSMNSIIGWSVFGLSLFVFLCIAPHSEVFSAGKFFGPLSSTAGTIIANHSLGANGYGGRDYAIDFSYLLPGSGVPMKGRSYSSTNIENNAPKSAVTVEYRTDHPRISRIQGLRSALYDWPIPLFAFIFPAGGLLLIIIEIRKGRRAIRALRRGLPAVGTLVSVKSTGSCYGRKGVIYRMTFQFTAENAQQYTASCATYAMKQAWINFYERAYLLGGDLAARKAEKNPSELQEIVLYDPADPDIALVPVDIGPTIRADEQGYLHGINPLSGVIACIIPLIVIIGYGGYLIYLIVH